MYLSDSSSSIESIEDDTKYVFMETFGNWQLGNQMFQYLFLRKISNITSRKLVFIKDKLKQTPHGNLIRKYFIPYFNYINSSDIDRDDLYQYMEPKNDIRFNSEIYNELIKVDTKFLNIEGFFQSCKYFSDLDYNNIFNLRGEYNVDIFIKYNSIINLFNKSNTKNNHNKNNNNYNYKLVSIHVRRGDYIKYNNYHHILPLTYYINVITKIKETNNEENLRFIILSDDIAWCQRLFYNIKDISYFSEYESITDLILMSYCHVNIISNSTFSLMGFLLNQNRDKKIIYPEMLDIKWFGINGPKYIIEDLIPLNTDVKYNLVF